MMLFPSICLVVLIQLNSVLSLPINTEDQWRPLSDGKCFLKVSDKMTWTDAKNFCAARSARLATPFLLANENILKNIFMSSELDEDSYWTALNKQGSWQWTGSFEQHDTPTMGGFTMTSNCGSMTPTFDKTLTVKYSATSCNDKKEFFCERVCDACINPSKLGFTQRPKTSVWYYKVDQLATWKDAQSYCGLYGALMPCIHDQKENDYVRDLTQTTNKDLAGYWLGGYLDESRQWRWVDNLPFCFDFWSPGEPNNMNNAEGFINIWTNQAMGSNRRILGAWNDDNINRKYGIMCQATCGPLPDYEYSLDKCPQSTFNPQSSATTPRTTTIGTTSTTEETITTELPTTTEELETETTEEPTTEEPTEILTTIEEFVFESTMSSVEETTATDEELAFATTQVMEEYTTDFSDETETTPTFDLIETSSEEARDLQENEENKIEDNNSSDLTSTSEEENNSAPNPPAKDDKGEKKPKGDSKEKKRKQSEERKRKQSEERRRKESEERKRKEKKPPK